MALSPEQHQIADRVDGLDLDPIRWKLMYPSMGAEGMNLAEADRRIAAYRSFLKLCAWYPDESMVPSELVDEAWHAHILDTRKYARDCNEVFGYFLHHNPYAGTGDEQDEGAGRAGYQRTQELSRLHFGQVEEVTAGPRADCGCSVWGGDAGDVLVRRGDRGVG